MSSPSRVQYWAALRLARHAASTGKPVTACPYDPTGDGEQRLLALVYVREYTRLHPPTRIDHNGVGLAGSHHASSPR